MEIKCLGLTEIEDRSLSQYAVPRLVGVYLVLRHRRAIQSIADQSSIGFYMIVLIVLIVALAKMEFTLALRKSTPSFRILVWVSATGLFRGEGNMACAHVLSTTEVVDGATNIAKVDDIIKWPIGRV